MKSLAILAFLLGCSADNQALSPLPTDLAGIDPATIDLAGIDLAGLPPFDLSATVETDLAGLDQSVPLDLADDDLSAAIVDDLAVLHDLAVLRDLAVLQDLVVLRDMVVLQDLAGADLSFISRDGGICSYPNTCFSSRDCNGYYACPNAYNPCRPHYCSGLSSCTVVPALPNYTPCDDNKGCTYTYPASGGCPSNKCVGGSNNGVACSSDAECPGGNCFMNRCLGGPNSNKQCSTNQDCTGGAANADCTHQLGGPRCNGGAEGGHFCKLVCVGGDRDGQPCSVNANCPGAVPGTCPAITASKDCPPVGRCSTWSVDTVTNTCKGRIDTPHCNTVADCPTTKYCALDPENKRGAFFSCYDANDSCCTGGVSAGPCLVWDTCDTANHVCVRTTQGDVTWTCTSTALKYGDEPCLGGIGGAGGQGDGGVCNNICLGGACTSAAFSCP